MNENRFKIDGAQKKPLKRSTDVKKRTPVWDLSKAELFQAARKGNHRSRCFKEGSWSLSEWAAKCSSWSEKISLLSTRTPPDCFQLSRVVPVNTTRTCSTVRCYETTFFFHSQFIITSTQHLSSLFQVSFVCRHLLRNVTTVTDPGTLRFYSARFLTLLRIPCGNIKIKIKSWSA